MNNEELPIAHQPLTVAKPFWADAAYIPLLLAIFTAFLFTIGYLVETVSLEKFGLNNSELMPDTATAITLGFRYILLNSAGFLVAFCIYLLSFLLALPSFKATFEGLPKVISASEWVRAKCSGVILMYKPVKSLFLLALLIIIPIAIWWNAINNAAADAASKLEVSEFVDIVTLKGKPPVAVEGRVLRLRNGVLAFRDFEKKTTSLYPLSEVLRVQYAKQ